MYFISQTTVLFGAILLYSKLQEHFESGTRKSHGKETKHGLIMFLILKAIAQKGTHNFEWASII